MKKIIVQLNKTFDNRVRLGIMSMLMVNDWVDFTTLRDLLELSDGRLASHIKALEEEQFIEVRKQFVGRKPNTSYRATKAGKKAFTDHLDALERMIKGVKE
ncbi:MAG: transcriptional regulator [Saprospiraceae bacterium]|nr:MAG: transcriptional regulator [Saprospiraceae bacterium]